MTTHSAAARGIVYPSITYLEDRAAMALEQVVFYLDFIDTATKPAGKRTAQVFLDQYQAELMHWHGMIRSHNERAAN
jgi:hypothetical protein